MIKKKEKGIIKKIDLKQFKKVFIKNAHIYQLSFPRCEKAIVLNPYQFWAVLEEDINL